MKKHIYNAINISREETPEQKNSVRGANAAWLKDGQVITDSNVGCLRMVLLRSKGVDAPIGLEQYMTFEIGYAWEKFYASQAATDPNVSTWSTDTQVFVDIPDTNTRFSGRPDHVVTTKDGNTFVVETKSVSSVNKFKDVFKDGHVSPNYLAQIGSYMWALNLEEGKIAYGNFAWGMGAKPDIREFKVNLDGKRFFIDGKPTDHTIEQLVWHKQLSALSIEETSVFPSRPANQEVCIKRYKNGFEVRCPFYDVCEKHDKVKLTGEEFVNEAKTVVRKAEQRLKGELG